MEWTQVLGIILGNATLVIPLFLWNRSESRSDIRHMDTKLDAIRELVREIHNENHVMMKDFHGRLCAIEERRNK